MKCKSCTNDVPPKFAHAIKTNICPFCGEQIMDSELQVALSNLQDAMEAATGYPEEVFDWLKCNFQLVREDETVTKSVHNATSQELAELQLSFEELKDQLANAKPVPRSGKAALGVNKTPSEITKDKEGNALEGEVIQDPEITNKFFKNAQVKQPADAAQHYKNMVKQIKEKGTTSLMSEAGAAGVISPEMLASADQIDSSEYSELFGESGAVESAVDSDFEEDGDIPAVALQMMNQAKSKSGDYNARDVAKLQELQRKSAKAGSALNKTGSVGLIRR